MSILTKNGAYDPLTVDTSYIQHVCAKLPADGHIDINMADRLATQFLECADRVTDEIARCSAYAGQCDARRREAKAVAIDRRITGNGVPKVAGTIAAQLYGEDADYKQAAETCSTAEAFLDWLRTKHRNLMSAHVLCKDLLKTHTQTRDHGRWSSINPHDIDDEPDYDQRRDVSNDGSDTAAHLKIGADDW